MKQTIPAPKPHTVLAPGKGPVKETIIRATIRRPLTTALMLLCAFVSFGQVSTFKTVDQYVLPASEWKDDIQMPDSMHLLVGMDGQATEIVSYDIHRNVAKLSYFNVAVLMDFADEIREEYNQYTGIGALHFYTLNANDCAVKGALWSHRLSVYIRPYDKLWLITYDSPCDGIEIRTGDPMLFKAMKWKPKPPKKAAVRTSYKMTGG